MEADSPPPPLLPPPRESPRGGVTHGREIEALVVADLVRFVFAKSRATLFTGVISGVVFACLVRDHVPPAHNVGWLSIVILTTLLLAGINHAYWNARQGVAEAPRWARILVLSSLVNGAAWGSVAVIAFPERSLISQMLHTIMIAGVTGVASAHTGSLRPAFFAFAIPAATPMILRHLAEGDTFHVILAILLLFFVLQMASIATVTARAFHESGQLRFRLRLLNRTLEEQILQRTAELRAALAAREEFIWTAAHELRVPVTSLLLSAQNVERLARDRTDPNGLVRRAASTMFRQSRQLARLIDTMLDAMRIASGRLFLRIEGTVDLARLVRAVVAQLDPERARSGSTIEVETPAGAVVGAWDRARLQQAVSHLLTNALKFGRGLPIRVRVDTRGDAARLVVEDHGMGISEVERARLFARFHRGVPARHYGGLGLGLYVVRRVVELHRGSIAVESAPGRGTTFTVELPRGP